MSAHSRYILLAHLQRADFNRNMARKLSNSAPSAPRVGSPTSDTPKPVSGPLRQSDGIPTTDTGAPKCSS